MTSSLSKMLILRQVFVKTLMEIIKYNYIFLPSNKLDQHTITIEYNQVLGLEKYCLFSNIHVDHNKS